jgi:hypothetical protein
VAIWLEEALNNQGESIFWTLQSLFWSCSINRRRLFPVLALGQYGYDEPLPGGISAAFPDKKIMLIWDQAGWHKSNSLKVPENIVLKSLHPILPSLIQLKSFGSG